MHRPGEVISGDRVVGYFEYETVSDIALPTIYETEEELERNWRGRNDARCTCGGAPLDVLLWADYGGDDGFHWPAQVCMACRAIVSRPNPYAEWDEPEWDDRPADGHPLRGSGGEHADQG